MKKLFTISLVAAAITSSAMADGVFFGVGADYSSTKIKVDAANSSAKKAQPSLSIKAGYDFETIRAYGQYDYRFKFKKKIGNDDFEYTNHRFIVGADFTPRVDDEFRLALGAYTGSAIVKPKTNSKTYQANDYATGFILGAKLGGIYEIEENSEIEFGVKYDFTKFKDAKETSPAIYLGYNFKF